MPGIFLSFFFGGELEDRDLQLVLKLDFIINFSSLLIVTILRNGLVLYLV